MAKKQKIGDEKFNSDTEIANKYHMSRQTYEARIKNKLTPEEAVSFPVQKRGECNKKKQKVFGKEFDSFREACEEYGQNPSTIQCRMKKQQITLEEALTYTKSVTVNGKNYQSKKDACDKLDLNYKTVISYEKRKGVSFEDACNQYLL